MERRVLLGTRPNFSIHFLLILGLMLEAGLLIVLEIVFKGSRKNVFAQLQRPFKYKLRYLLCPL